MIENTYKPVDVISEIRRTLQIFKPEPSLIEIRSPKGVGGCKSGYFTNHDKLIQQIQTFKDFDSFTWYFVLNDINQDCYNLEQRDTIKKYMPKTTADDHITNREWLLIDCDPKRMSDIPSTNDEKQHAWNTLTRIYDFLQSRGFYEPVVCDSGNGYHLLYRIDMENTKDNTEILKNFLKLLDLHFTDEHVQFDVSVFNASRITKLYGSWARKGSNTTERPHRQSYIIQAPSQIEITDISLIQPIADMLPKPEETKSNYKGGTNTFDVRDFMIQHGIAIQKEVTGKDYTKFVLETCPFNPEHGNDSAVFLRDNGQSGFLCFHNGCSGKGWKEFRTHFDPDAYEKKQHVTVRKKTGGEQSVDIASDDLYQRQYIYQEGERYKVNVPLLTEYFKQAVKYYLVKTDEFADTFMYVYRDGRYRVLMKDEIKGLIKSMIPLLLQTNKILEETYSLIFAEADTTKFIPLEPFNSDENIINLKNGLLHLDTVELKAHTPDVLSTIQIDCNYNPNAKQPANSYFEKYMQNLTGGKEDIRKFLLQYMGVALSNVYGFRFKKAFFMTGKGDSGKSQIKELCVKLIGSEYTSGTDLQTLEEKFGTSTLYNKRLVGSSDMKYVSVKELNNFKQITGGDSIRIEFKNRGSFAYKFKGVFWFICNELPKFGGDKGQHMYDRIIPLSFNNVIPEDKRDSHLLDKMYAEREYIVNLCIDGLKQVIANGYRYDIPMCSHDILRQYQHQNDSVLQFYDECCEPRINGVINDHITKGKTYQYYKQWCRMNNNGHSESKSGFHKRLQEHKIGETTKTNGGNEYYISFKMAENAVSEYGAMIN